MRRGDPSLKTATDSFQFGWFDRLCLWYPPGWLVLFNRHWQHYREDPDGWNGLEYALFLVPGGFYLALLIRWLRLGGRSPRCPSPLQPDPTYQQSFREEVLTPILKYYYQAELLQHQNLPDRGPLIVTMNHAGMCFPWDFMGLAALLSQCQGWFGHPVAHPLFFDHPWLRWWLPRGWAEVMGAVRADWQHLEAALTQPDGERHHTVLLYAPESWRGLAKGWGRRYCMETFDPNFVRLSVRYRVPILPVLCLGSENLHPWTVNLKPLADWFRLPLFPISPLILAFLLFPSLGVWTARSRLQYVIQPIRYPWEEEAPEKLHRRSNAYQWADTLRSHLQAELDHLLGRTESMKARGTKD